MNKNTINYEMLDNVRQPKLAQTLIKLSEVYIEYMNETSRADEIGVHCDKQIDNFIMCYNKLTKIITETMASVMDAEVNEAITAQ